MQYNPSIIAQILSNQAVYIDRKYGQFFYYTDINQIWYDTIDGNRVQATDIVILNYERERDNFVPNRTQDFPTEYGMQDTSTLLLSYSIVYVIETNCLYKYENAIWTTLYGIYGSTTVAQTYLPNGTIKTVVADDVTTNGILNDGSVVVRDGNKMICGLLRSDGYTFNVLSLIGGCINLDPSGAVTSNGCLQLTADMINGQNKANLNGDLIVFGNVKTVPKTAWNKQYRLVTENIEINSNTTIVAGSTLLAGSSLGDITYNHDTVLDESISATTGMIVQSSKIYMNSVINNNLLQPPFLFDLTEAELQQGPNSSTSVEDISLTSNTLKINLDNPFSKTGDSCYILLNGLNIKNITTVEFNNDVFYSVDYISSEGITNTAKIVYYNLNNTVKVLP